MEHGEFPLDKHGERKMISAPANIIGTSNPRNINATWSDSTKASKGEIPLRRELIDRFDIPLLFKDEYTEESAKDYAIEKIRVIKKCQHNYRFLKKFVHYVKNTITHVSFTKEAEIMIASYYASIRVNKNLGMTNRALETLNRICKAWARLHLKTVVDADIVNQVQKYFSSIILQCGEVINSAIDPRELAREEIVKILKQANTPIYFEEAARQACQQNLQVKDYVGSSLKLRENNKLREISQRVREYSSNIEILQQKPLMLKWIMKTKEDSSSSPNTKNNNMNQASIDNKEDDSKGVE
jgi:DNA replicative helicase MCM subunit Mcm2 (Cdc46/Mcm family)